MPGDWDDLLHSCDGFAEESDDQGSCGDTGALLTRSTAHLFRISVYDSWNLELAGKRRTRAEVGEELAGFPKHALKVLAVASA